MLEAKRAAAVLIWLTGAGCAALPYGTASVEEAKLTASDGCSAWS